MSPFHSLLKPDSGLSTVMTIENEFLEYYLAS
jgi:hypothetical protein